MFMRVKPKCAQHPVGPGSSGVAKYASRLTRTDFKKRKSAGSLVGGFDSCAAHHVSQGSTWFRPMILRRSGFQPRPSVTILIRLTTRS